MERAMRLELTTYSMASCRSSQLSYARVVRGSVFAAARVVQGFPLRPASRLSKARGCEVGRHTWPATMRGRSGHDAAAAARGVPRGPVGVAARLAVRLHGVRADRGAAAAGGHLRQPAGRAAP